MSWNRILFSLFCYSRSCCPEKKKLTWARVLLCDLLIICEWCAYNLHVFEISCVYHAYTNAKFVPHVIHFDRRSRHMLHARLELPRISQACPDGVDHPWFLAHSSPCEDIVVHRIQVAIRCMESIGNKLQSMSSYVWSWQSSKCNMWLVDLANRVAYILVYYQH